MVPFLHALTNFLNEHTWSKAHRLATQPNFIRYYVRDNPDVTPPVMRRLGDVVKLYDAVMLLTHYDSSLYNTRLYETYPRLLDLFFDPVRLLPTAAWDAFGVPRVLRRNRLEGARASLT